MAENNVFTNLTFLHGFISYFIKQEINPFSYVEINGLKIAEPAAAYNLLWEGVSGHDVEKDGQNQRSGCDQQRDCLIPQDKLQRAAIERDHPLESAL